MNQRLRTFLTGRVDGFLAQPPLWPTFLAWLVLLDGVALVAISIDNHVIYKLNPLYDLFGRVTPADQIAYWGTLIGWPLVAAGPAIEFGAAAWLLTSLSRRCKLQVAGGCAAIGLAVGVWLGVFAGVMTWLVLTAVASWAIAGTAGLAHAAADQPTRRQVVRAGLVTLLVPVVPLLGMGYWYVAMCWNLPLPWPRAKYGAFGLAYTGFAALAVVVVAGAWYDWRRYRLRRRLQKPSLEVD